MGRATQADTPRAAADARKARRRGFFMRGSSLDFTGFLQGLQERVGARPRDATQRIRIAMGERRRLPTDRQVRPSRIGPAAIVVELDVDAVVVGSERLLEEPRRADSEAGIASTRL